MALQEKSTGRAVCSAIVRRFDGSFFTVRPVRRESVIPLNLFFSGAARSALARGDSVSSGSGGEFRGIFAPACAGIRGWAPGESIGKFADGTEGCSASIGTARRKIETAAEKRLQFSGGWGKRKQQYRFTPKEVTQMLGDQERRCGKRRARFDAGFKKIINATDETFRYVVAGGGSCELKPEQQSLRGE